MTNYELFRRIASLLTNDANKAKELFDYIIYTMDDNGFLRTCWCKKPEPLQETKLDEKVRTALIAFEDSSVLGENLYSSADGEGSAVKTNLKMMLFPYDLSDEKAFDIKAHKCMGTGFSDVYKVSLSDGVNDSIEKYGAKFPKYEGRKPREEKKLLKFME